jgi:NitT/TauT family transport system ATP-binding protein
VTHPIDDASRAPGHAAQADGSGSIEILAVSKRYRQRANRELEVLRSISLTVPPGSFVTLVGPSGCGKSTLLKLIAGLETPTDGEIVVDSTPVTGPRRSVGLMFQTPELFPWRNVLENALLSVDVFRQPRDQHIDRARHILGLVGLQDFARAYPRELSGGMQQRAALARTLMADPSVLLMDEPFAALDELTRERLNVELLRIWDVNRKTIVFVTHNIAEAAFLSDWVVVMGRRPSRIVHQYDVPLARPRSLDDLSNPLYQRAVSDIRSVLRDD